MAAAVGCAALATLARHRGVAFSDGLSVGLLAVAGAWIGAVAVDAAVAWRDVLAGSWRPGLVFYGGLGGGISAAGWFVHRFRLDRRAIADAASVAAPLAHAFGRVGCLLAGCCFGRPAGGWPGIRYSDPLAPATAWSRGVLALHPVQLYESIALVILAGIALVLLVGDRLRGRLLLVYLGGYAMIRLCCELLRGDPSRGELWGVSTSQWIALAVLMGLAAYAATRRSKSSA